MAEDKDLFGQPRDRRGGTDSGSNGSGKSGAPRTPTPRSSGSPRVSMPKGYRGGFLSKVNRAVAKQHAAKGTNRYSKSKPKTGRFNARGRGRRAYANGIGPKTGWQVHGGIRYRARREVAREICTVGISDISA